MGLFGGSKGPSPPSYREQLDSLQELGSYSERLANEVRAYAEQADQFMQEAYGQLLGFTLPAITEQFEWARQDRERLTDVYQPLEQGIISNAQREASQEAEMEARARAGQDAMAANEARRQEFARSLAQYGLGPEQLLNRDLDIALEGAKSAVLASETAGDQQRRYGFDALRGAQQMGLPYQQGAQTGLATGLDASRIPFSAAATTTEAGFMGQQQPLPYLGMAGQGYGGAADVKNIWHQGQLGREATAQPGLGDAFLNAVVGSGVEMGTGYLSKKWGLAGGAEGGAIEAPGGPKADAGALKVSDGEYILPAEMVNKIGSAQLDKAVEKLTGARPSKLKALPVK